MRFDIVSLFPGYFDGPLDESILGRARRSGLLEIGHVDLRQFGEGAYAQVDDRTYGGGPGMVLMPGPTVQAINSVRDERSHVVHLSPQGRVLNAQTVQRLAKYDHLILLCGHYEGIDQRVLDSHVDEEVSIGDYVLTNGCLPALVLIDAVARFVPGVLKSQAVEEESFQCGTFDWPHYTRPQEFEGQSVPEVLRSGDHAAIERWRKGAALEKTVRVRPDLAGDHLSDGWEEGKPGITLWVEDIARAVRFYRKELRFSVEQLSSNRARISLDGLTIQVVEGKGSRQFVRVAGIKKQVCDPDGNYWGTIGLEK